jgi:chromosome segregation ATPase
LPAQIEEAEQRERRPLEQAERGDGALVGSASEPGVERVPEPRGPAAAPSRSSSDARIRIAEGQASRLRVELAEARRALEEREARLATSTAELAELEHRIERLESSIDSHRAQIAAVEGERATLVDELASSSSSWRRTTAVLGLLLVGLTALSIVQHGRARRRASEA